MRHPQIQRRSFGVLWEGVPPARRKRTSTGGAVFPKMLAPHGVILAGKDPVQICCGADQS